MRAFCFYLLMMAMLSPARAETVTIAMSAFPPDRANPFRTTANTPNQTFAAMFDQLTMNNPDGELEPWLATEWQRTGELTWAFTLRDGVTFWNGKPFDAAMAKRVFDRLVFGEVIAQTIARELFMVERTEAPDARTFVVHTKHPVAILPRLLTSIPMADMDEVDRLGFNGFGETPMGTGPFQPTRWAAERAELKAVRTSWRAPKAENLTLLLLPDISSRLQALRSGRTDVAMNLSPDSIDLLESEEFSVVLRSPATNLSLTFMTTERDLFKDVRLRKAVRHAIDLKAITEGLLYGLVEPATQSVPANALGYDPELEAYAYDPDLSRQLMAEAGYPDGFSFEAEINVGTIPYFDSVMQQVALYLAQVGITMEMRAIPFPTQARNVVQGGWKGDAFSMDFSTSPSLDGLRVFRLHSCSWTAPWYCDETIQPVIEAAHQASTVEERLNLTRQALRYYHDQAQSVVLFESPGFDGVSPRVSGYRPWNNNPMHHMIEVVD